MNSYMYSNFTQTKARDGYITAVSKNVILLTLYFSINYINGTIVHTFVRHEIFSENPRYVLFIHMVVNDMIQLTIAVILHLTSYIFYIINVSFCCFLLMIAVFTTLNTPLNLAGMAIERYIAICNPLYHRQICTVRRTYIFISLIWFLGSVPILPDLFILVATEPSEFFYSAIICNRDSVFRHPYLVEKKNVSHLVYLFFVWLTLVYTYFKIIFAAKTAGSHARKARNTIILHGMQLVLCMFTYIGPPLESFFTSLFPLFTSELKYINFLFVHVLPRFLSPIIYGWRDQMLSSYLKRDLLCNKKKRSQIKTQSS
ncbi:odorant receptor 131-2-like [Pangasianodon hypophthalmus]|uniref:odorant receptor 131-2-like n=1 Tax=Pangasianodon hypophthalmus TaxID=310915 RepID=UPI002307DBD6|nr:odorant receptor 131-2-like [Pangasianodon hypophthalmus]